MTAKELGDQPAHPHFRTGPTGLIEICPQGGMTLRQYYAGLAMQGILSKPNGSSTATYSWMVS